MSNIKQEQKTVYQVWAECDSEWYTDGWFFTDDDFFCDEDEWEISEVIDKDKFGRPILAYAIPKNIEQ